VWCLHRYLVHAEGAGNDGAQQDHDAVELAQLVAAQHGEGDGGGDAVEKDGGDETPHEDRHPGKFESVTINGTCFHANKMLGTGTVLPVLRIRIRDLVPF
jgi:hypothetical protein